jgi:hypothetical protein
MTRFKPMSLFSGLLTIALMSSFLMVKPPAKNAKKIKNPCKTCVINGPCCVLPGADAEFTLTGGTTVSWNVSCGTIIRYSSTSMMVSFPSSGCALAEIETVGATCGGTAVACYINSSCPNIPPCEPEKSNIKH